MLKPSRMAPESEGFQIKVLAAVSDSPKRKDGTIDRRFKHGLRAIRMENYLKNVVIPWESRERTLADV